MATAPTTSINQADGAVIVQWDEPDHQGSLIIQYHVEFFDQTNNEWIVDPTNCNGLSTDVIENRRCNVPMSQFTGTLGYQLHDSITVRVSAINEKGISLASPNSITSATAKFVPQSVPSDTIVRGYLTTENQIHLLWSPLTTSEHTGDSIILSYNVQFDQGNGQWMSIVGVSSYYTQTEAFITENLEAGVTYKIRIRALNIYGWSETPEEPYAKIDASGIPQTMQSLIVEYDEVDPTLVKINWQAPYANSEPITMYHIMFE